MYYCLGFVFNEYEVLLTRKKFGPPNLIGKLNGIGGKVNQPEEGHEAAMERECLEETGHSLEWDYSGEFQGNGYHVGVYTCFEDGDNDFWKNIPKTNDVGEELLVVNSHDLDYMDCGKNLSYLIPLCWSKSHFNIYENELIG